ncbi:MAG: PAS domain-containing protein [Xanthobacteraceae bacterium]
MGRFDEPAETAAETALRQREAQLAEAQRQLQLTIDTIPALVVTFEPDGARSFVNQTWRDYTGLTLQETAGEGIPYFHPDDLETAANAWRASLASGQPFLTQLRLRGRDGKYRWHTVRRVPLRDDNGDIIKWYGVAFEIEDQKIAENALRCSEALLAEAKRELQATLDSIPILAWRARADGFAEYLNKRWLDYTGVSLEQSLGWQWQAVIHPDDVRGLHDAWRDMLASGKPGEVEARMRRFDGAYRWFLFRAEPLRDEAGAMAAWYGTNTDIEDRKRAEIALQRSEAYSAEAQKLSMTGSFAWDFLSDDHFWSDQTYEIMGFDRSIKPSIELINQRVHPDDRGHFQREIDRTGQGAQTYDYEQRLLMPDGHIKHLHLVAHRVRYESGKEEIVGAIMDVTEARKSQEALHAAQAALAHASRVATLGEISATIAHEVNQPLAAIITNGEAGLRWLARPEPDVEEVRELTRRVVADARRASEIVGRILAMAARRAPEQTLLALDDVIAESMVFLRHEFQSKGVSVALDRAPALPRVVGDRTQLQQVVVNLAINAVQAMAGAVHRSILIRTMLADPATVCCMIEDSGPGIDPMHLPRIFDSFFTTKDTGMGIGLRISRSIIEAHNGQMRVDNESALGGARFSFALPCHGGIANDMR